MNQTFLQFHRSKVWKREREGWASDSPDPSSVWQTLITVHVSFQILERSKTQNQYLCFHLEALERRPVPPAGGTLAAFWLQSEHPRLLCRRRRTCLQDLILQESKDKSCWVSVLHDGEFLEMNSCVSICHSGSSFSAEGRCSSRAAACVLILHDSRAAANQTCSRSALNDKLAWISSNA